MDEVPSTTRRRTMKENNLYLSSYCMSLNSDYFKEKHFRNLLPQSKTRRVILLSDEDIGNLDFLSEMLEQNYKGKLTNSRVIRVIVKKIMDDLGLAENKINKENNERRS